MSKEENRPTGEEEGPSKHLYNLGDLDLRAIQRPNVSILTTFYIEFPLIPPPIYPFILVPFVKSLPLLWPLPELQTPKRRGKTIPFHCQ